MVESNWNDTLYQSSIQAILEFWQYIRYLGLYLNELKNEGISYILLIIVYCDNGTVVLVILFVTIELRI